MTLHLETPPDAAIRDGGDNPDWPPRCFLVLEDGERVDLHDPDPALMTAQRMARGLSRLPRWCGHTDGDVYSVAQHSVWVYERVCLMTSDPVVRLQALLHDGPEFVIGDMPSPMKAHCAAFRAWEDAIWRAICGRWRIPVEMDPQVKAADRLAQDAERAALRRRDAVPCFPSRGRAVGHGALTPQQAVRAAHDFLHALRGAVRAHPSLTLAEVAS